MASTGTFDLERFVVAQEGVYTNALAELRAGHKRTHWIWFIFPQFAGLGKSERSRRFAIQKLAEARAYLGHPILGARLLECVEALLQIHDRSAREIVGHPDDLKLRSSATLFAHLSAEESVFHQLLDKFFQGVRDPETMVLMGRE